MKLIAVTQRVVLEPNGERRDSLDQRWHPFLKACNLFPILIPNDSSLAETFLAQFPPDGILLTGGNDLCAYGGDAQERDATEKTLLDWAQKTGSPLLGVCRGMQMVLHAYGVPLVRLSDHAGSSHLIESDSVQRQVNSYHDWGATSCKTPLQPLAWSLDGVLEAVKHSSLPIYGIQWHPERMPEFNFTDLSLFKKVFS